MSRRAGDTACTRNNARFHFMLAVRRIRPECFIALGRATLAPAGEEERAVRIWAEHWGLTAEWCVRWALDACLQNRAMGEIVALPTPVEALSRGPEADGLSVGIDGCPGFLRWLQQQKLSDLAEWFRDSDLWELAGSEEGTAGRPQRKAIVAKRLRDGCGKLITKYVKAVETQYRPKSLPEAAFGWLARRVVPTEPGGQGEKWEAIAPGDGERDDSDDNPDESKVRKDASALARFIALLLPNDRTRGR